MIPLSKRLSSFLLAAILFAAWFPIANELHWEGLLLAQEPSPSYWIQIKLPITGSDDEAIIRKLEEIADKPSGVARTNIVLEFVAASSPVSRIVDERAAGSAIGQGTQFVRALSLARWLTGPKGTRLHTIAYLPKSIEGHAVLVALGCEEMVMAPDATIGNASANEPNLDTTIRQAYLDVNAKWSRFPRAAVESMVDGDAALYQVDMVGGGQKYMLDSELEPLRGQGKIAQETELSLAGAPSIFSGAKLLDLRWISNTIERSEELPTVLGLPSLQRETSSEETDWKGVRLQLHGNISAWSVNRLMRGLESAMLKENANLALIDIDSPGGSFEESLRLARHLASFKKEQLRTVAYVSGTARGDAAMIAMACNMTYLSPTATLGGAGEATIAPSMIEEQVPVWEELSRLTGRSEGEFYGPMCPGLETFTFVNAHGNKRWASEKREAQAKDGADWTKGDLVAVGDGMNADDLLKLGWIRGKEPSLLDVAKRFGLQDVPKLKQSNPVELFVQRLGQQGWLPPLLLFVGFIMLMTELSTPGVSIPGFISALCFILFFWTAFLNGTVEWLEILLFVGGIVFIAFEIFVLPGAAIFGFGGLLMLLSAVVLASQTFLFPSNPYQWVHMAWNMSSLAATFIGIGVGLFLIRNHIDRLPMIRWLKLHPPSAEEATAISEREAVVHWEHLNGKRGITITRCNPSGKARIGDSIVNVISLNELIAEDQSVRVIEVRGNTVVVESIT